MGCRTALGQDSDVLRRLHPPSNDELVSVRDAYSGPRQRTAARPWVGLCMVSSVDGSTVIDDRSAALSSPTDTEVLLTLRSLADVILVGASTVRIEGYGPPSSGARVGVVSRTGHIALDTPLFTSGAGFLVLPIDAPPVPVPSVRAGNGTVDLASALGLIDANFVQCEGGAALNAAMFAADVVDELNLTVSPQIAGGSGPRLLAGAPPLATPLQLFELYEFESFLFTRYRRP
jgi:riboflavin biosynthesis pyrimidine reductase